MTSYNFFLAKKFAGKKRCDSFLWFITAFSIAGVAIGVVALMLVIGVMNGFSNELKRRIVGSHPIITVEGRPYVYDYYSAMDTISENVAEVKGISPYMATQVLYKSRSFIIGGILRGIDPEREADVTNIDKFIKTGKLSDMSEGIILGSELAKELGVEKDDYVDVIAGITARQRTYRVVGISEYGVYNFDSSMGFASLGEMQNFLGLEGRVHGLGMRVENIYDSERIAQDIRDHLEYYYTVSTWIQKNRMLFAALAIERKAMALILGLIVLVASFNISSTLMITVYRKVKEIGVLRSMGLSSREIKKIFYFQGMILGGKGLGSGLVLGCLLAWLLKRYQFIKLPEFIYDLSTLPIEIAISDVLWIVFVVLVIISFASLYPAQRASKLDPARAIRNE